MNTQCWKRNTSHVKFSWDTCGMRQKPMNSEKSETAYTRATHDREALGENRQPRLNWNPPSQSCLGAWEHFVSNTLALRVDHDSYRRARIQALG